MTNKIIQWSIRGAKTNINELIIFTSTFNSAQQLCLQETY